MSSATTTDWTRRTEASEESAVLEESAAWAG
jgi:hypothetical protein